MSVTRIEANAEAPVSKENLPQADGNKTAAPPAGERPAWLPEKFKSAEDLAAAYTELEKKQSAAPKTQAEVDQSLSDKGIDLQSLSKEFIANNGALKPETVQALKTKGFSEQDIATYVEGAKSRAEAIVREITAAAGSEANRDKVYAWAKANLSPEEIDSFNAVVDTGNKQAARLAFEGLHSRYLTANGQEPELLKGKTGAPSNAKKGYASNAEIVAAMSDPRYRKDAAYRAEVEARMAVTNMSAAAGV